VCHTACFVLKPTKSCLTACCTQCCGSMTFWYGSRSADPCLWPMDQDPAIDPAILDLDLQDTKKKLFFSEVFCLLLFEHLQYILFLRLKVINKSQNSRNQGFYNYFCLMIELYGSRSVPLTNGSLYTLYALHVRLRCCPGGFGFLVPSCCSASIFL
jgi:hypothetical protein